MAVRSRWVALGASLAMVLGAGGVLTSAAGSPSASSFVPITPCRLFDTRSGADNVGPRSIPLGADDTFVATVWGVNGNCSIPAGATGVSMNVAIINPTASSFLTVFPADQVRPLAANLNWVAGQDPTPNAVTAALSADGNLGFYNLTGTVDLAVDVNGFYELSTAGPQGPKGDPGEPGAPGAPGTPGDPGPRPTTILWVAQSGGDYTTVTAALAAIGTTLPGSDVTQPYLIKVAPGIYTEPGGLDMKNYVDLEGSGQDTTTITCACGSGIDPYTNGTSATVRATGPDLHTGIRNLTITNTGGNTYSTGVWTGNTGAGNVALRDVAVTATGGTENFGVYNNSSSPTMTNVTATAIGGTSNNGVYNDSSSPTMTNVTATAIGGTSNNGVYNDSSSPTMTNVTATAIGDYENHGVYNDSSSPTMTNVTATATAIGGDYGYGVGNGPGSTVVIRGSFIRGSSFSVHQYGASVLIFDTMLSGYTSGMTNTPNQTNSCYNVFTTTLTPFTCT